MKAIFVGLVLALLPAAALAADIPQYLGAVHAVRLKVEAEASLLKQHKPLPSPPASAEAKRLLLPIKNLQSPGGHVYALDAAALVAEVRSDEALANHADASARLDAVAGYLAAIETEVPASGKAPPPASAKASARSVLARPEFQSDPEPEPSVFQKWGDTISKWFKDHWPKPATPTGPSWSPNINVIYSILGILVAGLFVLLVWIIVGAVGRRAVRARPLAADDTEAALVEARDTDSILDLADGKARGGDYRSAFRLVYLATLVALDTGGILRFDRSKTNWEYLRALRSAGRSDIFDAMQPLTRDFDRLWYGFATAGPDDYQRARRQYELLTAPSIEPVGAKR